MVKLSKRLQAIADYVTEGSIVADIGSDHALLPVYLLQNEKCSFVIAGELNSGPFHAAKKQAAAAGLNHLLDVRQGDGLSVLTGEGEADTVTIAGMGGSLITDILEDGRVNGKLHGVRKLILQPNVGEEAVRRWLAKHEWYLIEEAIIEEDGKIYEMLVAANDLTENERNAVINRLSPSVTNLSQTGINQLEDKYSYYLNLAYDGSFLNSKLDKVIAEDVVYKMGPYLLRNPEKVFISKWEGELDKLNWICRQLEDSDKQDAAERQAAFRNEIKVLEEVLRCLSTDKR